MRKDKKFGHRNPEFPISLRRRPVFKPALVVGGLLKLRKFDIVRTDRRYVKKTGARFFTVKTNEITRKHLILCSSISDKWQKTLKTPDKVPGPVGKVGFWVG